MNPRNNREEENSAEGSLAGYGDPALIGDLQQKHEENRSDLGKGVGFAEDAGAEVAQSSDGEEHGAGGKDQAVAAEDDDGELPWNFVQDREHEKNRAEQSFVGDGIEVLAELGLLLERAGEQAVEAVAEAGEDEEDERGQIMTVKQVEEDEWEEDHPEQRELVGVRENL